MYEIMSPTLTVASAKDHFSEVLEKVEAGASIRICRRDKPVAELRPIPHPATPATLGDVEGWLDDDGHAAFARAVGTLRKARSRNPFA